MAETAPGTDLFGPLRERIQRRLVEHSIPSLAVAVAREGVVLWEEAFGWADREQRITATPHTLYSLASISKPITTTGLMILKERGLLDLDRPINDYLGESKLLARVGNVDEATVRRVANHTSGLPGHYRFFYEDEPGNPPSMDETIQRYGNLVRMPGERYLYSNLGYGILGEVIARLSGKSYADFLREELFLPLGMLRASVNVGSGLEAFQAQRYAADETRYPFYDFDHPGASAAYGSAHDLLRFGMFHLKQHLSDQKAVLSDESLDEMQVPTAHQDKSNGYGFGWSVYDGVEEHTLVGHGGGMDGVNTVLSIIPTAQIAIVVLVNTSGRISLANEVADDILRLLLPAYAEKRAVEIARRQQEQMAQQTGDFQPDARLVGQWRGQVHTYEGDIPFTLLFRESGDVHAQLGTQLKTLVNDAQFKNLSLTGKIMGDIGTRDADRYPHYLHLDLALRGDDVLNGALMAITRNEKTPGHRLGVALNHWLELRKEG